MALLNRSDLVVQFRWLGVRVAKQRMGSAPARKAIYTGTKLSTNEDGWPMVEKFRYLKFILKFMWKVDSFDLICCKMNEV